MPLANTMLLEQYATQSFVSIGFQHHRPQREVATAQHLRPLVAAIQQPAPYKVPPKIVLDTFLECVERMAPRPSVIFIGGWWAPVRER